jgi:hypothetical protein
MWLRRACRVALIMLAAYLVVGNLLLNLPAGRRLASLQPQKFVAGWSTAWTLYPGHFRVNDLRIAGHIRRTVWSAQVDTVSGRIALLPLLARELRIPRVIARGATGGASLIDLQRLPPDPRPGGWVVRFDNIIADGIRHVYFGDLILVGDGRAEIGFLKVLRSGPLEVLPSSVRFVDGVVWRDGAALARDATVEASFAVDRHLRTEAPGILKLARTDLEIAVEAKPAGVAIETPVGGKPAVRIVEGPGALDVHLHWLRGSLASGGTLRLTVPVQDDLEGRVATTLANLALDVADDELRLAGMLAPAGDAAVRADADLRIRGREIPVSDIASLVPRTSGHVTGQWRFASLAWLGALMPGSRLLSFDGAGSVIADLNLQDGQIAPGSVLKAPRVAATAHALGNRFDGDASAEVSFQATVAGRIRPHLDLAMDHFLIASADTPGRPYVRGRNLKVQADAEGEFDQLRDSFTAHLGFNDAEVPDLRVYNHYLPNSRLEIQGGSGRLSGDLNFDAAGDVGRGTLKVSGRGVRLGLAGLTMQGDLAVNTRLRRADLRQHAFDLGGSRISLQHVDVLDAAGPIATDWWADVDLDRARLDWDKPMSLDSQLQTRMQDASVLLGIYAQKKDFPRWIGRVVDTGEVNAHGRVQLRQKALLLAPFEASNERFDVDARLLLQEKRLRGDLFARWGVLTLGLELENGEKKFHMANARNWFDTRPVLPPP